MSNEDLKLLPLAAYGAATGFLRYYVRPELTAKRAWIGLAAGIVMYEAFCPAGELLSEGADRVIDKYPIGARIGGLAVAGALTGHVLNLIPEQYDVVHQISERFRNE